MVIGQIILEVVIDLDNRLGLILEIVRNLELIIADGLITRLGPEIRVLINKTLIDILGEEHPFVGFVIDLDI